jgi:hypothetical protein
MGFIPGREGIDGEIDETMHCFVHDAEPCAEPHPGTHIVDSI